MTDQDHQLERDLRAQAKASKKAGGRAAALILADFYEERGQPSRANLWRDEARLHGRIWHAADLVSWDTTFRRKVMMWLLGHVTRQAEVARLFQSSPSWVRTMIREVETSVCEAANRERHHPTLKATLRLQAVGALSPRFERGSFELGEEPPATWPVTREEEAQKDSTSLTKLRNDEELLHA